MGQSALLAGVISNPEGNNPFFQPERAKARRSFALQRMVTQHVITKEQAAAAELEPLPTILPTADLRPRTRGPRRCRTASSPTTGSTRLGATRKTVSSACSPAACASTPRSTPSCRTRRSSPSVRAAHQQARVHRRARRDGPEDGPGEGDGRRPRVRGEPVQHRHELPRSSGRDRRGRRSRSRRRSRAASRRTTVCRALTVLVRLCSARPRTPRAGGWTMTLRSATVNSVNCALPRAPSSPSGSRR